MTDMESFIRSNPGFSGPLANKNVGYTLPDCSNLDLVEVEEDSRSLLEDRGIQITGKLGVGNKITVPPPGGRTKLKVSFHDSNNNTIIVSPNANCQGVLNFLGSGHLLVCNDTESLNLSAMFRSDRGALFIGSKCTGASVNFWIEGPEVGIQVGDDCMFSWGIYIRTSDGHGIIDVKEGKKINTHANVLIGTHVWVGQDALINKGVKVGSGSIIGARSVVTKSIPRCCSAAGVPAKVIRHGTTWTRHAIPDDGAISKILSLPFVHDGDQTA